MISPDGDSVKANIAADILDAIARNESILRCADLRDVVRRTAPADLAALGVDRPDLRWQAARAFIRSAQAQSLERLDAILLRVIMLDRTLATWVRRGSPGFAPDASDVTDAQLAFRRQFCKPAPASTYTAPRTYGRTSDDELLRLARDQEHYEAERAARNVSGAA